MDQLVGQTLGQYRVDALIGQGGMARVYRAYQPALDRDVAIKVISTQIDDIPDKDFVSRFNVEARLVAKLSHPHIVPIHDFGEDKDWAFIVMEYLARGTLRDRLVHAEAARTRLNLPWVLTVLEQAAQALDFAHQNGVVHRDVKPANMLLRVEDQLVLSDFGIATILEASKAASRVQAPVGTPQYMAPEQGLPNAPVSPRTDIYALGIVLFHCVTGRLPFTGSTPMAIIVKQMNEPLPPPSHIIPGLPPRIEQIILRATAKHPLQRYPRALDMANELRLAREELRLSREKTGSHPLVGPVLPPPINVVNGRLNPELTCFRCGMANSPGNKFCTTCGYDLSGARSHVDKVIGANGRPLHCRIIFRNGPLTGRVFVLHQDTTTLGRTNNNDIVVPGGTVSRFHAKLSFSRDHWIVEDLKSSNGTFVNGRRIRKPCTLKTGDEVRLGDEIMMFEVLR